MIKPAPGARVVPRPVASTPADAASEDFYRRCRRADAEQVRENNRAQRQAVPVPSKAGASGTDGAPAPSTDQEAAAPSFSNWQWPTVPASAAPTAAPDLSHVAGPSIADRMRARHAAAAPSAAPAGRSAEAGLADRMRARFGLSADAGGADHEPELQHVALKTAGR